MQGYVLFKFDTTEEIESVLIDFLLFIGCEAQRKLCQG
jgi:hypothetical protein